MARAYQDADWLRSRYRDDGHTQQEIADQCGVTVRTIRRWMTRHDIDTREIEGENHGLHGTSRTPETRRRISESLQGRQLSAATRDRMAAAQRGKSLSEPVKRRISEALTGLTRSPETRERMSRSTSGPRNPMWKGGGCEAYGPGWSRGKRLTRDRDEVCQQCGHDGTSVGLEVHHIIPIQRFVKAPNVPTGRGHDPGNLVLLCAGCHQLADNGMLSFESALDQPETHENTHQPEDEK